MIVINGEKMYTPKEVAELKILSQVQQWKLRKNGKLKCYEFGRKILISEKHLSDYFALVETGKPLFDKTAKRSAIIGGGISMNIEQILTHFPKAKKTTNGYVTNCPSHDDSNPSLLIKIGTKRIFLNDLSGKCTEADILHRIGLKESDLFFGNETNQNSHNREVRNVADSDKPTKRQTSSREICSYQYKDETGKLIYENVRFEISFDDGSKDKSFAARRFYENGKAIWNLLGVKRVPYRLPELIEALKNNPSVQIYLTEGEKDAENLRTLKLVARVSKIGVIILTDTSKMRTSFCSLTTTRAALSRQIKLKR